MHTSVSGKIQSLLVSSFFFFTKSLSTKQYRKVYPCHFMTLRILIYSSKEQSRFLPTFLLWFNWMIFRKTLLLVFQQNYYDCVLVQQTSNIHVFEKKRKRWLKLCWTTQIAADIDHWNCQVLGTAALGSRQKFKTTTVWLKSLRMKMEE